LHGVQGLQSRFQRIRDGLFFFEGGGRGLGNFHRTFCFPGPNFVVKKESVALSYSQSGGEKLKMSAKLCNYLSQENMI